MGLDYFRSATGKACAKRWNGAHNFLKLPDLFQIKVVEKHRTVMASLHSEVAIKLGAVVVVRAVDRSLIVCENFSEIGRIDDPSATILQAVIDQSGIAAATVERVGMFGNCMELSLK